MHGYSSHAIERGRERKKHPSRFMNKPWFHSSGANYVSRENLEISLKQNFCHRITKLTHEKIGWSFRSLGGYRDKTRDFMR